MLNFYFSLSCFFQKVYITNNSYMKINNNKGKIMNKFTKVGLTALAGSLVAISAQAVEMTVSGSAKLTYHNGNTDEITGNPYGMNTSMVFSGSGEVNGYATNLTIVSADAVGGMSSAALSIDLADMGKITFDQHTGAGGISTIDDKTPTAAEEVWDGLDATTVALGQATTTGNGLVGGGNDGVFVYSNSFMGSGLSVQVSKGASAINSDDAVSGGTGGSSWDFALTNSSLVDGLDTGFGYGKIANGAESGVGNNDTNEHMVAFVNYTMGMVTAGYSEAAINNGKASAENEYAKAFGIAANINDNLSISYGEREIEHTKASASHVTEDIKGYAIAYTMGSAKITAQQNETSNNGGTLNLSDETTQIALSLSF
jgi:outer membrane protein OmpU